jgi:hypothetical protein
LKTPKEPLGHITQEVEVGRGKGGDFVYFLTIRAMKLTEDDIYITE